MNKSEQIGNLAKALSTVQSKLEAASKDRSNPFFKSHYSTLNAVWDSCRALLAENGLAVAQLNQPAENGVIIETVLMHESGEWISGELFLPLAKHDPQGVGSAITYGRRYALAAMIGIVSDEDDDGNAASQRQQQKQQPKQPPRQDAPNPKSNDLPIGTRIRNAERAIKELGVNEPPVLIEGRSDEELATELEALSEQYKRLKANKK